MPYLVLVSLPPVTHEQLLISCGMCVYYLALSSLPPLIHQLRLGAREQMWAAGQKSVRRGRKGGGEWCQRERHRERDIERERPRERQRKTQRAPASEIAKARERASERGREMENERVKERDLAHGLYLFTPLPHTHLQLLHAGLQSTDV